MTFEVSGISARCHEQQHPRGQGLGLRVIPGVLSDASAVSPLIERAEEMTPLKPPHRSPPKPATTHTDRRHLKKVSGEVQMAPLVQQNEHSITVMSESWVSLTRGLGLPKKPTSSGFCYLDARNAKHLLLREVVQGLCERPDESLPQMRARDANGFDFKVAGSQRKRDR